MATAIYKESGPINTTHTLELVLQKADALGISDIIIASKSGRTALEAALIFAEGTSCRIICAPFQKHLRDRYCAPDPAVIEKCIAMQVLILPDDPEIPLIDEDAPGGVDVRGLFVEEVGQVADDAAGGLHVEEEEFVLVAEGFSVAFF